MYFLQQFHCSSFVEHWKIQKRDVPALLLPNVLVVELLLPKTLLVGLLLPNAVLPVLLLPNAGVIEEFALFVLFGAELLKPNVD